MKDSVTTWCKLEKKLKSAFCALLYCYFKEDENILCTYFYLPNILIMMNLLKIAGVRHKGQDSLKLKEPTRRMIASELWLCFPFSWELRFIQGLEQYLAHR